MPDASIYRAATTNVLVASADAVLDFTSQRDARTVTIPVPAGGNAYVVRPHGPRSGTFRFGFTGATAQTRAEALEASLATGALHYLADTGIPGSTWRWRTTGQITVERVHDVMLGRAWVVTADWTAA